MSPNPLPIRTSSRPPLSGTAGAKRALAGAAALLILATTAAVAADTAKLRAPGSYEVRRKNDVGIWKTADAAEDAELSLDSQTSSEWANLTCLVKAGTTVEVIARTDTVAKIDIHKGTIRRCAGYVRLDFLSRN